jgi:hypothetical protein
MKTTLTTAAFIASFAILGAIFVNAVPAVAQLTPSSPSPSGDQTGAAGANATGTTNQGGQNFKWGEISSIQNDEQGKPAWIVSGHWRMDMGSENNTAASGTTGTISKVTGFHAIMQMVRLNGSAMHSHEISNFAQSGDATFDSSTNSTTITGTATITMREGPVPNTPMTIKIAQDKVIAITPDPAKTQNHFGNTPVYGVVGTAESRAQEERIEGGGGGGGSSEAGEYSGGT